MNKQKNKIMLKIFTLLLFISLFLTSSVKALSNLPNPPDTQTQPYVPPPVTVSQTNPVQPVDLDGNGTIDVQFEYVGFDPVTGMPKIKETPIQSEFAGGIQYIDSPFIPQYIALMYKYAIAVISILSVVMIIFAGVLWIISAGNAEKINRARQMIGRSLTGLVIALGSYTLLYVINPNLVNFTSLQILKIEDADLSIPEDYSIPDEESNYPPSTLTDLASLSNIDGVVFNNVYDRQAKSNVVQAFKDAVATYKQYNGKDAVVSVNSAVRTPEYQYGLLERKCGCHNLDIMTNGTPDGKFTPVPGVVTGSQWQNYCTGLAKCVVSYKSLRFEKGKLTAPLISHVGGNALDLTAQPSSSAVQCGSILSNDQAQDSKGVANAGKYNSTDWCIPKAQQLLIRAMLDKGFCVLLKGTGLREPWHFELMTNKPTSSACVGIQELTSDPNLLKLKYTQNPNLK